MVLEWKEHSMPTEQMLTHLCLMEISNEFNKATRHQFTTWKKTARPLLKQSVK